jgi:catechol 2,3-dioxygenase-like lactoylglutathione lyase family enzyme
VGNIIRITPFIHVPDLEAAVSFLTDTLGFTRYPLPYNDYAYVYREATGIRLLQSRVKDGTPPGNRRFAYYIYVNDVDTL